MNWDQKFMNLARHVGEWSKDQSRGVGCVIVGPDHEVISMGYNGFPRGVDDTKEERHQRPAKYSWTEHAERNAIYNAARNGISTKGATMYILWHPCVDCARAIIQSGIAEVVHEKIDFDGLSDQWKESFKLARSMFQEVGLSVRFVE